MSNCYYHPRIKKACRLHRIHTKTNKTFFRLNWSDGKRDDFTPEKFRAFGFIQVLDDRWSQEAFSIIFNPDATQSQRDIAHRVLTNRKGE